MASSSSSALLQLYAKISIFLAFALAVVAVILTGLWAKDPAAIVGLNLLLYNGSGVVDPIPLEAGYLGSPSWDNGLGIFSWHALLMVFGFFFWNHQRYLIVACGC